MYDMHSECIHPPCKRSDLINNVQFSEDFSNYWTAILYFRARNGTFKRVPQKPNVGFEAAKGGMTVYYLSSVNSNKGNVTAFKKGFRMITGMSPLLFSSP
jgi:hypothetical protein